MSGNICKRVNHMHTRMDNVNKTTDRYKLTKQITSWWGEW